MEKPTCPASPPGDLPVYYTDLADPDINASFRDFDNEINFDFFDRQTRNPSVRNFCLDFGDDDAYCAFDLTAHSYTNLLHSLRPPNLHTRWINLWVPYIQRETLHVLAKHYDFSPRLLGLMCSEPVPPKPTSASRANSQRSAATFFSRRSQRSHKTTESQKSKRSGGGSKEKTSLDSEESIGMTEMMHSTQLEVVRDLSHYHIVNDVWHWSSVDWGRRFVCLGYNTLHNVRTAPIPAHSPSSPLPHLDHPQSTRIWNWLLLCNDKTVISISEDPFPFHPPPLLGSQLRTLYTIRRNLVSVFRQLTKAPTPLRENELVMLPIRHRLGDSEEETAHRSTDSPGLLFYYLFEDWWTTYSLVTRREHGYAAELDRLRRDMLDRAALTHIDQLHHIGCQLSLLKRVYQSYDLIIERVLKKQEATLASLKNSHIIPTSGLDSHGYDEYESAVMAASTGVSSPHGGIVIPEADSLLGVSLSSAARVRFERLRDRICLYALSEIQECIDQKESLVMMNFNLIAIKESLSVESLTRITLLLAEITILFMPVTLMTGYFSVQFAGVQFDVKTYWWAFAIVLGVSCVLVFLFSWFTGTLEGRIVGSGSWSRRVVGWVGEWFVGRGKEEKEE